MRAVRRQDAKREEERDDADRQVDQEDPVPADGLDEPAAQDRAADRAEQHRHTEDGHHAAHPVGTGCPGHDGHAQRHQHAAAKALQGTEGDERADVQSHAAQDRAGDKQHE